MEIEQPADEKWRARKGKRKGIRKRNRNRKRNTRKERKILRREGGCGLAFERKHLREDGGRERGGHTRTGWLQSRGPVSSELVKLVELIETPVQSMRLRLTLLFSIHEMDCVTAASPINETSRTKSWLLMEPAMMNPGTKELVKERVQFMAEPLSGSMSVVSIGKVEGATNESAIEGMISIFESGVEPVRESTAGEGSTHDEIFVDATAGVGIDVGIGVGTGLGRIVGTGLGTGVVGTSVGCVVGTVVGAGVIVGPGLGRLVGVVGTGVGCGVLKFPVN